MNSTLKSLGITSHVTDTQNPLAIRPESVDAAIVISAKNISLHVTFVTQINDIITLLVKPCPQHSQPRRFPDLFYNCAIPSLVSYLSPDGASGCGGLYSLFLIAESCSIRLPGSLAVIQRPNSTLVNGRYVRKALVVRK